MSNLREQKPVVPCTLPVKDPSLPPEGFGKRQGYAPCALPCLWSSVSARDRGVFASICDPRISLRVSKRAPERSAVSLGAGAA
jgi:hypothetical protein